MNSGLIILAIICIWPADGGLPKVAVAEAPSMEVCQADVASVQAKLQADPAVRSVSTTCLELNRAEKS